MVRNLLVLVAGLYRFFRNGEDIEDTDNSPGVTEESQEASSSWTAMDTLTTIDLGSPGTTSTRTAQSASITQSETTSIHNLSSRSCVDVSVEHD